MIIIRYTDFEKSNGELLKNVPTPTEISKDSIYSISPMVNDYGAFYKNVTVLRDYEGNVHKVKGNYKHWISILRPEKKIGFK